jgi:hypothetical protein
LARGRGIGYIIEASPLFDSPLVYSLSKERGEGYSLKGWSPLKLPLFVRVKMVYSEEAKSPLFSTFPLPLQGRGV